MVNRFHRTGIVAALSALLGFLAAFAGLAKAAELQATLDRESVPAGNGALLTVTVSGGGASRPEIPQVKDLIVQGHSQGHQMRVENGRVTNIQTYTYVVGSNTPGDYEIPAITVTADGKAISSPPLKLKVLDSAAAQPPAGMPQNQAPGQPAAEPPQEEDAKRFGFLTVELAGKERSHVYVGEIAPVRIRAWLPANSQAQLRSGVQPEGKGFTLHNVSDQPQQTQEMRDGKRYTVVTWFGGISATKPGKLPASLSLDATVAVRDPSAPKVPRQRSGPFSDPFFDDAFDNINARMIQKDVTLKSDDQEIEVRALPAEGRPEGFHGAVGKFQFSQTQLPSAWATGEPQQIGATLEGSGNFALVDTPQLTPAERWKTYSGKNEFTPGDQASFSGSKAFRFSAVARKGGDVEGSLAFSFFNPDEGKYETVTSPPQKLTISGNDIPEDQPAAATPEPAPPKKESGLIGQHTAARPAATLVPLVSRPEFAPLLAASGGLCLLGAGLAFWRVRRNDPQRLAGLALEKATREALAAAGAASDVPGFFAAARLALQQRLGSLWNQPPQAITSAEIESRFAADSPVARFFREADQHEYNRRPTAGIEPQWRSLLDEALASLTPTRR